MLDSCARTPFAGLLSGTVSDFGNFEQCLKVESRDKTLFGKYCLTTLVLPTHGERKFYESESVNSSVTSEVFREMAGNEKYFRILKGFRFGFCFPNNCSKNDLQIISDSSNY